MSEEITTQPVDNSTPTTETPAPAEVTLQPGTPEYDAAMAARGTAEQAVQTTAVPEKFQREDGTVDMEALAKSYAELEKQFHAPKEEAPPIPTEEAPKDFRIPSPQDEVESEEPAVKSELTQEDYNNWGNELASKGEFSEATIAEIKSKTNFTDQMINDWTLGQKAKQKEAFVQASQLVGGEERLGAMFNWAANNLPRDQQEIVNQRLAGPDYEVTLYGLASMYDKAMAAAPKAQEPVPPQNRAPNPAGRSTVEGFTSYGEFTQARSDPRYMQDANYRNAVEERMVKTDWQSLPR